MKKISFIFLSMLLLVAAGCSDDKDDSFPRTPVNTTDETPEEPKKLPLDEMLYSNENLSPAAEDMIVTTKDGWTVTTYGDMITKVEFGSFPPSSPEQFFEEYIPLTDDNRLVYNGSDQIEGGEYHRYLQYYKGRPVYQDFEGYPRFSGGYICYFDTNKRLTKIEGFFAPIDDLDVNPVIKEDAAKDIANGYCNSIREHSNCQVGLFIVPFYKNGKIDVRLTYYAAAFWTDEYLQIPPFFYIDANTGELIYSNWSMKTEEQDDEEPGDAVIDPLLPGRWKLVKTYYDDSTTLVTNNVFLNINPSGRYWLTTDSAKSEIKTMQTFQGTYLGESIDGSVIQASDNAYDAYKYRFSEDNNTLTLSSYYPSGIYFAMDPTRTYTYQRIE